jgi:hypothetical protein
MPKLLRKISVKKAYENANAEIIKAILSDKPKDSTEINIEPHYKRSTNTLGGYVTLDWEHRKDIRHLIDKIAKYSADPSRKRPMNIIMIAEPGSGKSYFIKCLAKNMDSSGVSAINFNMANMNSIDDLMQPLEMVRNLKVVDRLPLLFLDEFDSSTNNYSLLLPLLWDGELHVGHRDLRVGKLVIIMAGSDQQIDKTMRAAKSMQKVTTGDDTQNRGSGKLVDLLSRVNGGIFEIPGLDIVKKNGRDRRADKVCVTISLLQERFGSDLQLVPWCLLNFIASNKFRYGVRSIAHIIDLIPWDNSVSNRLTNDKLELPLNSTDELKNSSIAYHIIAEDGPDDIVDVWNDISSCSTLVRFQTPSEEDI